MSTDSLRKAFEAHAKAMREFGYPDCTSKMVAEHHAAWKRGEARKTDVLFLFSTKAFKDHPELFGSSTVIVTWAVSIGLQGGDRTGEVEVPAHATDAEIEDEVRQDVMNYVEWSWERQQ